MTGNKHNEDFNESVHHEDTREAPPSLPAEISESPKRSQIQDLMPVLGKYTIDNIKDNKEAIGMIVQLLLDRSNEVDSLKNEIVNLRNQLKDKSVDYASERTKLNERWKSHLGLQLVSFLSALAIGFSFQFTTNDKQFWLLLIIGIISGIFAVIGPFVINRSESKRKV